MKLPLLRIKPTSVVKTENDIFFGRGPTPVGQLFAFHSAPLLEAANAWTGSDLCLHEYVLRMAIEGLWQMRTKYTALVGYIPDSESTPIIRLFLMGRRDLPFGRFTAAVSKYPGYMESGRGYIDVSETVPLAYWEYPCSAYAIWPNSPEGIPFLDSDLEQFESKGSTYWMIHREFEFANSTV